MVTSVSVSLVLASILICQGATAEGGPQALRETERESAVVQDGRGIEGKAREAIYEGENLDEIVGSLNKDFHDLKKLVQAVAIRELLSNSNRRLKQQQLGRANEDSDNKIQTDILAEKRRKCYFHAINCF